MKTISFLSALSIWALINTSGSQTQVPPIVNATLCDSTPCLNRGKCVTGNDTGIPYCDCTGTGYGGIDCREKLEHNQTACGNGTCLNGGRCIREYSYHEYCNCSGTGYGGEYCDTVPVSACDGYCTNGGVCSETFGIPFCACPPGLGGPRCGMIDPTNYCRTAGPNDVEFLPLCTLRNTTEQLIDCVTNNMAGVAFGSADNVTCLQGIHQMFTCVGNVIGNCSRSTCPSIYHLPGVGEAVKMMVESTFDPSVIYIIAQFVCSPVPPGGFIQYLSDIPNVTLASICPNVTVIDMVNILRTLGNGFLNGSLDLTSICRVISQAQDMAYQLSTRCDMSAVINLLPPGYEVIGPYIQRGFNTVQNMLSNYTISFCKGVTSEPGPGMCPRITNESSQCDMTDAWMCQRFLRGKELSTWMEEYMVWWRSCSVFAERDWDHWASSMGLKRGDYMYGGYGMSMGEDGFVRMVKANLQCPFYSTMDCNDGWTFTDVLECKHCYRGGTPGRNSRSLFIWYMDDYQRHTTIMKIYNALRQDCAGTFSGDCGGGDGGVATTMPPYTTPDTTWSWTTASMPNSSPEGTTHWAPQGPWTTVSMPNPSPKGTTHSTPLWPWTTVSMPNPSPEGTTHSTPQWPSTTVSMPNPSPEGTTNSATQRPWKTIPVLNPSPEGTTNSAPQRPWTTVPVPNPSPEGTTNSAPQRPWTTIPVPNPSPEGTTDSAPQGPWTTTSVPNPSPEGTTDSAPQGLWTTTSVPNPSSEGTTNSAPQEPWTTTSVPNPSPEGTTNSAPQGPWTTISVPNPSPERTNNPLGATDDLNSPNLEPGSSTETTSGAP